MTRKYNKKDKLIRLLMGDTFHFLFFFFFFFFFFLKKTKHNSRTTQLKQQSLWNHFPGLDHTIRRLKFQRALSNKINTISRSLLMKSSGLPGVLIFFNKILESLNDQALFFHEFLSKAVKF